MEGLLLAYKAGYVPILGVISGVLGLLILWLKFIASTGFWKPIYCLDVGSKTAVTPKAVFASELLIICVSKRGQDTSSAIHK